MANKDLFYLIKQSMLDSVVQVRRSLGRKSYASTRSKAVQQVKILELARQAKQVDK